MTVFSASASPYRPVAGVRAAVFAVVLTMATWLSGDSVADDRGSDAVEKSFMTILGIAIGGAVTAAVVTFVATKTALFK